MALSIVPISNCAFSLDYSTLSEEEKWFVTEIMKKTDTMEETRKEIAEFDRQLAVVITVKKRIISQSVVSKPSESNARNVKEHGEDTTTVTSPIKKINTSCMFDVGFTFERFFSGAGWFSGTVTAVNEDNDTREVKFSGGNEPTLSMKSIDIASICAEPQLGEINFQFVKKFKGGVVFRGVIESASRKGTFVCKFEDGDRKTYTRENLEKLKQRNYPNEQKFDRVEYEAKMDSDDSDTSVEASLAQLKGDKYKTCENFSDSEEETIENLRVRKAKGHCNTYETNHEPGGINSDCSESDSEKDMSTLDAEETIDIESDNETLDIDVEETIDIESDNETLHRANTQTKTEQGKTGIGSSNWKYGHWLMGKSLEELERMPSAELLYMKVLEPVIKSIGERMGSMKLGERNVEVTAYPDKEDAKILHDCLSKYEPNYDESIREKKHQSRLGKIDEFLQCPKHTKKMDYLLEFKLCGEVGCRLCPRMPRVLQMRDASLREKILGFCPLPRLDVDGQTFLPIDECQQLMDNGASLNEEMKDLHKLRQDSHENTTEIKEKKKRDGCLNKSTHWSKVRMVHKCEECGAPRCFYSHYAPGHNKGPKKKHFDAIKRLVEDHGNRCGDIIRVFKDGDVLTSWDESSDKEINDLILFCKESHVCGTAVESQYYAPPTETERGRRVSTKHVCCHCYADSKFVTNEDVEIGFERRRRAYLPMCRDCLDNGVSMIWKKGKPNIHQREIEKRAKRAVGRNVNKRTKKMKHAAIF